MSEEIKEVNTYKIFRQLEERKKRANPYTYYDKDELIDEILKQEDKIEDLQQKVEQLEKENEKLKQENKRIFQNVNDDELLISNAMNYAELKKAEKRVEQLENIRKEAIEYVKEHARIDDEYPAYIEMLLEEKQDLLNILNKGDKNVKG